jgi:hypothetical protein
MNVPLMPSAGEPPGVICPELNSEDALKEICKWCVSPEFNGAFA